MVERIRGWLAQVVVSRMLARSFEERDDQMDSEWGLECL